MTRELLWVVEHYVGGELLLEIRFYDCDVVVQVRGSPPHYYAYGFDNDMKVVESYLKLIGFLK